MPKFLNTKRFKSRFEYLSLVFEKFLTADMQAKLFLKKKGVSSVSLAVALCGAHKIKKLNHQFRDKNKITDVISFQMHDDMRSDSSLFVFPHIELGDIYICNERMISQSKQFNISSEDEFFHLVVHGFLHVLGYDHEISKAEEKIMESFELKIIKKLSQAKV